VPHPSRLLRRVGSANVDTSFCFSHPLQRTQRMAHTEFLLHVPRKANLDSSGIQTSLRDSRRRIIIFYPSELNTPKLNLYRRRKTFCQTQESSDCVYQRLSTLSTVDSFVSLFPGPPFRAFRALFCRPAYRRLKPQHSRTTSRQTGKMLK
jgi:hypothetical protein